MKNQISSTYRLLLGAALATALLGAACSKSSDSSPRQVAISFKGLVAGAPFSCTATYQGIGNAPAAADQVLTPQDFRFYVHDVRLVNAAGTEVPVEVAEDGAWQHAGVTLIDFEDATGTCTAGSAGTNTHVVGTVPAGDYVGLRFKLGVPFELNHLLAGSQPAPLNTTAMFWSWTSGYRFLRVEGTTAGAVLHLGSTGCTLVDSTDQSKGVTSCANPNRVEVSFPAFDVDRNAVVLDLARVWADTNLATNTSGTSKGCMSGQTDPECAPIFPKFGLPIGATAAGTQTLFTME